MPAPPQQMGGPMQPLPPWVLQQQQQQQQEREQQQQQHEREQQQQQQNGAVVIAGAEPEGGFGDGHGSGSSSARRDGEAEERVGQRAGTGKSGKAGVHLQRAQYNLLMSYWLPPASAAPLSGAEQS
eukprot:scaffold248710_cov15-Tisochrysis_lutea.AAC.1